MGENAELINVETGESLGRYENRDLGLSFYDFWDFEAAEVDGRIMVVGNLYNEEKAALYFTMLVFSEDFQSMEVIDLQNRIGEEENIGFFRFIEDGKRLLLYTGTGLYLYDYQRDIRQQVLLFDWESHYQTTEGLFGIESCDMLADGQIVFTGYWTDEQRNSQDFLTIGTVNPDGSELQFDREEEHHWGKIWVYDNCVLIEESEEIGLPPEEAAFCCRDGEISSYPLASSGEYLTLYPSRGGEYYATRTKYIDEGYIVRVYSSADGSLVREIPLLYEEYGEDLAVSNESILIEEETGQIVILAYNWKNVEDSTWLIIVELNGGAGHGAETPDSTLPDTVLVGGLDANESNSILQTGEREICLFSDKPYLYDIVTGERLAEAKETFHELVGEGDFLIQSVLETETGIMVCGEKFAEMGNGDAEYILIEYDKNLSYIRQFNLAEATGTDFGFWGAALMCASQDGKLLFYPGWNGLYCYNMETQENRELLSEETSILSIAYLDKQQELFFVASTTEKNADGE